MFRIFLITILICIAPTDSFAKCKWGDRIFERGVYSMAIPQYYMCESRGDAYAQYKLGQMYYQGLGFKKNFSIAVRYFKKAGDRNFHEAQQKLGIMFWRGDGVVKNKERAYMWLTLAADENDKESVSLRKRLMGTLTKEEIKKGDEKVLQWRIRIAEKGHAAIRARLGLAYWKGENVVKQDPIEAYKWLQLSAEQGDPIGIELRDGLLPRLSEEQLKAAKSTLEKWKKDHP